MGIDRRAMVTTGVAVLAGGLLSLPDCAFGQKRGFQTEGTLPVGKVELDVVDQIINALPSTTDYVAIMRALADLGKTAPLGPDKLPYNERWPIHANPLLTRMWRDVHEGYRANDCDSWCGVAMGWCLQRSGRDIPADTARSQSFLSYGDDATHAPIAGDLVVFTNYGDAEKGHVTIFIRRLDTGHVLVLGGNQQLSGGTNCPAGFPVSVVDERSMAEDTRKVDAGGRIAGHRVAAIRRPPVPVRAPAMPSGAVIF